MARRYITPAYIRKPKKKRPRVHSKNRHTNQKNGKYYGRKCKKTGR